MIYSKEDVKRILKEITDKLYNHRKCRPTDCGEVQDLIDEIERRLNFKNTLDLDCPVCRGSNGKHTSLCGEQYK